MITDEMVEKAWQGFGKARPKTRMDYHAACMRASLEAVAPMIIAQGLRDLARDCYNLTSDYPRLMLEKDILAHAQELDQK